MEYYNEYLDYFLTNISGKTENYHLYEEMIERFRSQGKTEKNVESLQLVHSKLYRKANIKFLDYANFWRCKKYDISLD